MWISRVALHGPAQFDLSQPCISEAEAPGSPQLDGGNAHLPAASWQKRVIAGVLFLLQEMAWGLPAQAVHFSELASFHSLTAYREG